MTQVHDVLSAIAEAKTAFDELPQVKAQLEYANAQCIAAQRHSQNLELRIIDYKQTVANLQVKIRSLEVERDDAGFRELETADKLDALRNVVLGVHTTLEKTLPKAEPVVEAPVVVAPQAGTTDSHPTASWDTPHGYAYEAQSPVYGTTGQVDYGSQSESPLHADPVVEMSDTSTQSSVTSSAENNATSTTNTTPSVHVSWPDKPYAGKSWNEVPDLQGGINAWLTGGGSEYGYWNDSAQSNFDRSKC